MRVAVLGLFLSAGLPLAGKAQGGIFGPEARDGSYTLVSNPRVRYAGKLLVSPTLLVAKDEQGEKTKWRPEQVARLTVEHQRYTTAQGFSVRKGISTVTERKPVFVELLDSGRVSLMRYTYPTRMMGMQGGNFLGPSTQGENVVYLIRDAAQPDAVALPVRQLSSREDYFQGLANLLGPYLGQRPDLQKLLNQDKIEDFQLQRFVHALNTNSYF